MIFLHFSYRMNAGVCLARFLCGETTSVGAGLSAGILSVVVWCTRGSCGITRYRVQMTNAGYEFQGSLPSSQ